MAGVFLSRTVLKLNKEGHFGLTVAGLLNPFPCVKGIFIGEEVVDVEAGAEHPPRSKHIIGISGGVRPIRRLPNRLVGVPLGWVWVN